MHKLVKKLRVASGELYIHRRTRHTIKAAADDLEGVLDAWTVEGPVPAYHQMMQDRLRRDWPTLANALDNATSRG